MKLTDIPYKIHFGNSSISRSNSVKYLGVILDKHLTWNEHIADTCNKLKRYFKIFYSIRRLLNTEQVKTIYYALIYSRIKYGILVYRSANKNRIARIQTLQNKLLKVLLSRNYRHSTNKLHNELEILKVNDIAKVDSLTFIHNYFSNKLPRVFNHYFTTVGNVHNINTRGSKNQNISVDKHKNQVGYSTMKIKGANGWNNTSAIIKKITNIKTFRNKLKYTILPYQGS